MIMLWLSVLFYCVVSVLSCPDGSKLQLRNNISPNSFKAEYTSALTLDGVKVTVLPWLLVNNSGCLESVQLQVNVDGQSLVNMSTSVRDQIQSNGIKWIIEDTAPCKEYSFRLYLVGKSSGDKIQVDQINNINLVFGPATPQHLERYHHPWSQLSSMELEDKVEFKYPGNLSWKPAKCAKEYKVIVMPDEEEIAGQIDWEQEDAIEKIVTNENSVEFKDLKPCQYYIASISVKDQYGNNENMELCDDGFDFYSGPNKTELSLVEVYVSVEENEAFATWKPSDTAICDEPKEFSLIWKICHGDLNYNCSNHRNVDLKQSFNYSFNFSGLQNCTNYTIQVFLELEGSISLEVGKKRDFFVENCKTVKNHLSDVHDEENHKTSIDRRSRANIINAISQKDDVSEDPENMVHYPKSKGASKTKKESESNAELPSSEISSPPENLTQDYSNMVHTKSSKALEEPDNDVVTGLWVVVGVALLVMVGAIISVAFDITLSTIRKGAWTLFCSQRGVFKMDVNKSDVNKKLFV